MDVQLRVAVAAGVLREDRHRDLPGVLESSGLHTVDPPPVMTGPHVRGLTLHMPDVQPHRLLDLRPDTRSPGLPLPGRLNVAGLPGLDRRGQRAGMGQRDGLIHAERGVEVLHPDRALVLRSGLGQQPHPLIRRRPGMRGQFRLVDRGQLGVDPRRAAEIRLACWVARVEELAVQRLEVLPPHHVPVVEAEFGGAVADPRAGGLAAFLHSRQVIARAALASDHRAFGGADRLERVGGVVPAGDADDDRHDRRPLDSQYDF